MEPLPLPDDVPHDWPEGRLVEQLRHGRSPWPELTVRRRGVNGGDALEPGLPEDQ